MHKVFLHGTKKIIHHYAEKAGSCFKNNENQNKHKPSLEIKPNSYLSLSGINLSTNMKYLHFSYRVGNRESVIITDNKDSCYLIEKVNLLRDLARR